MNPGNVTARNLDDIKTSGMFYCTNSSTSLPVEGKGGALVVVGSSSLCAQIFFTTEQAKIHRRSFASGSWSSWTQL